MTSCRTGTILVASWLVGCGADSGAPSATPARPEPPAPPAVATGWNAACGEGTTFAVRVWRDAVAIACARPDGVRHGPFSLFWSDGAIAVDGQYDGGARTGTWTVWNPAFGHEAAELATVEYQGGAPVDAEAAALVWWLDDGACPDGGALSRSRFDERTFVTCKVDGVAHGPAAEFYDNGRRQAVGAYRDDEQHGRWLGWREEDGTLFGEAHFDHGIDVGRWQFWDASGALIRTEVYEHGELVETITP